MSRKPDFNLVKKEGNEWKTFGGAWQNDNGSIGIRVSEENVVLKKDDKIYLFPSKKEGE